MGELPGASLETIAAGRKKKVKFEERPKGSCHGPMGDG
jgi:hypothetical protein